MAEGYFETIIEHSEGSSMPGFFAVATIGLTHLVEKSSSKTFQYAVPGPVTSCNFEVMDSDVRKINATIKYQGNTVYLCSHFTHGAVRFGNAFVRYKVSGYYKKEETASEALTISFSN